MDIKLKEENMLKDLKIELDIQLFVLEQSQVFQRNRFHTAVNSFVWMPHCVKNTCL